MQQEPTSPPQGRITLHSLFIGPDGLRAIWALLLFDIVRLALRFVLFSAVDTALPHNHTGEMQGPVVTAFEAASLATVLLSTWLLATIEGRRLTDYGLGDSRGLRRFLVGAAWGAAFLALLVFALHAIGALAFDGRPLAAPAAVKYGSGWLVTFVLVGLFEETLFRGYALITAARGLASICRYLRWPHADAIGFSLAALALSAYFGFGHGSNPGESPIGLISAGLIALIFCFTLWRTGSLWWAIGFHVAWDWMESFFFGVSDSGSSIQNSLFTTHPLGDRLLSGGATGPEGSLLVFPILALATLVAALTLPSTRRPAQPVSIPPVD